MLQEQNQSKEPESKGVKCNQKNEEDTKLSGIFINND